MQLIDEILEYLQYHSMSMRQDVERHLSRRVSSATVKRQIAKGIEDGLIVSHGNNRSTVYSITPKAHLLRTVNLDSYYAKSMDQRDVQTGYNFDLIRDISRGFRLLELKTFIRRLSRTWASMRRCVIAV